MEEKNNEDYWRRQASRLEIRGSGHGEISHVHYAKFIADHCADRLKFMAGVGWYRWDDKCWNATGDSGAALQTITEASRVLLKRAVEFPADQSWALPAATKMTVHGYRTGIMSEMSALEEFRVSADDFDFNRHLLTFQNGTVDLRTGELQEHNPADMLTQCANVDYVPDAECPRWVRFVKEVFPDDEDLQRYYQTFTGMCVTGEVRDHVLGVWYGAHGRNGKGTTIRTMQAAFGKAVIRDVPFSLFERSRNGPHTEVIAGLRDARMIVAQEGNDGAPMDTARIKNFTGGDSIMTRHLRERTFTFEPKFTVVLATNHLPEFSGGGAALWARTKAILFGQSFAGRVDETLEPTIQGPEIEGVAAWVVEGAVRYYAEGLNDPLAVTDATEMHRNEVDPLKDLIGEVFEYDEGTEVLKSEFNRRVKRWKDDNGDTTARFNPSIVKRHLENHGVTTRQVKSKGVHFVGIRFPETLPSAEARAREAAIADGTLHVDLFGQDRPA